MKLRRPEQKEIEHLLRVYLARKVGPEPIWAEVREAHNCILNSHICVLELLPNFFVMWVLWEDNKNGWYELIYMP